MTETPTPHIDLLRSIEFFADAPEDDLRSVAEVAFERELVRNDVLFAEGDDPDSLFVVLRGRIAIVMSSEVDRRESVVALMDSGDLFGELGMIDEGPRSASARALEPSEVLEIPYAPIRAMFDANPALLWNAARILALRLRGLNEVLSDSVFLDVTGRTAKRLVELSNGMDEFVLPVTQEELAGMVGASRERVNKAIASFVRLGWIDQHERSYRLRQRDQLEQRAR